MSASGYILTNCELVLLKWPKSYRSYHVNELFLKRIKIKYLSFIIRLYTEINSLIHPTNSLAAKTHSRWSPWHWIHMNFFFTFYVSIGHMEPENANLPLPNSGQNFYSVLCCALKVAWSTRYLSSYSYIYIYIYPHM